MSTNNTPQIEEKRHQQPKRQPKSAIQIIRVHAPENIRTKVHSAIIRSRGLWALTKMMLIHLLDQSRAGEVHDTDYTAMRWHLGSGPPSKRYPHGSIGEGLLKRLIKNAKDQGFLRIEQPNSIVDGTFLTHWYVAEQPGEFHWGTQMGLPFTDDQDEAAPSVDKPPTVQEGDPLVGYPPAAMPTADLPTAAVRHHMVNYGAAHHGDSPSGESDGQDRVIDDLATAAIPTQSPPKTPQSGGKPYKARQRKQNAVGGPCLRNIDDPGILPDTGRLAALWAEEKRRGAVGDDAGCSLRQFIAAAVRASRVARREGGNAIAIFAKIVNSRATHNGKQWVSITEDEWAEADRRLREYHEAARPAWQVARIKAIAQRLGSDPFHVARSQGLVQTIDDWERMESEARRAEVAGVQR